MASRLKAYLDKHQRYPLQVDADLHPDLAMIIVIPCHDEPDLLGALESLWLCTRPRGAVEVLVVINAGSDHPAGVHARNRQTLGELQTWTSRHSDPRLKAHALYYPDLPAKHAGVGLARKLGMDEALARLAGVGCGDGIIVGFDADCRCLTDYLTQIETHFNTYPLSPGCAIHFEHSLTGDADQQVNAGIALYELYLRYYLLGLRHARFPFAFHTVGSSMAVRAWAYAKQGGMNRRQAGEDFYFLNKIIALGGFTELHGTTVIPSSRRSHRVPFGTGRAMTDWLAGEDRYQAVFSPELFEELRQLFLQVPGWFDGGQSSAARLDDLPGGIAEFLSQQGFEEKIHEIRNNVSRVDTFVSRFFAWFDAFQLFKFLRWDTAQREPSEPLVGAVLELLEWRQALPEPRSTDVVTLLRHLRELEKVSQKEL